MEIWHRVVFGKDKAIKATLERLGIKYRRTQGLGDHYIMTFDIDESDPAWQEIYSIIKERDSFDMYNTIFSPEEILAAEWIRLQSFFEQGYPQPESKWKKNCFEKVCPRCGIVVQQKTPLHIKKEPSMGKKDFLSLYWSYALLCKNKVIEVLKNNNIRGYEIWPVIIHSSNIPSKTISQLFFPYIARLGVAEEDKFEPNTCSECGITSYHYHNRGYMHMRRDSLIKDTDFQLTNEWFGNTFQEILISNRVAKLFLENKWQGVTLKPVILY